MKYISLPARVQMISFERVGRRGVLRMGEAVVRTPAFVLPTRLMAVPCLTRDMYSRVLDPERTIMEVYYEDLWQHPEVIRRLPMTLKRYANLEGYPMILALREDRYFCNLDGFTLVNSADHVCAVNHAGVVRIGLGDFQMMMSERLGADACILPVDHYPLPGTLKRIRKSVHRTKLYSEAMSTVLNRVPTCVVNNKTDFSETGPLVAFSGNSFGNDDVFDLLPESNTQCRYFRGRLDLAGIRRVLQTGKFDLVDASYVVELSENGKALQLPSEFDPLTVEIEVIDLKDPKFKDDTSLLCAGCPCPGCQFMKAYVYHLFFVKEMLGPAALMAHNLHQLTRFITRFQ